MLRGMIRSPQDDDRQHLPNGNDPRLLPYCSSSIQRVPMISTREGHCHRLPVGSVREVPPKIERANLTTSPDQDSRKGPAVSVKSRSCGKDFAMCRTTSDVGS